MTMVKEILNFEINCFFCFIMSFMRECLPNREKKWEKKMLEFCKNDSSVFIFCSKYELKSFTLGKYELCLSWILVDGNQKIKKM